MPRQRSTVTRPSPTTRQRLKNSKCKVNKLFHGVLYETPTVALTAWPLEQIAQYKLNKNATRDHVYLPQRNENEPDKKKQKLSDANNESVQKAVLSKEGVICETNINYDKENNEKVFKENNTNSQINEIIDQENIVDHIVNISTNYETSDNIMDFSNNDIKLNGSTNYSKLFIRDMSKVIKLCEFENFYDTILSKTTKKKKNKLSIIPVNPIFILPKPKEKLTLSVVEHLYQKYFSKSVQDNNVIVANILNIIDLSEHHKERMEESMKKKSESERYNALKMHLRHNKILVAQLKKHFLSVLLQFSIPDFESAFKMVFLTLLTILKSLKSPIFKNGKIFRNLISLLWTNLKKNYLSQDLCLSTVFTIFKSESKFRSDCIHIISLIEDGQISNPGITDRLPMFFVAPENSQEHFQVVIDSITSYSDVNLDLLIDKATIQYKLNSTFKISTNFPSSSTINKNINLKMPVSAQNTSKNDDSILHCDLVKTLNGIPQHVTMNALNSKDGYPATQENENENSSTSSVSVSTAAYFVPKISVPISTISSSNMSNSSSQTNTTRIMIKPKGMKCTTIPKGSTIIVGNKKFTVVETVKNAAAPSIRKPCALQNCQNSATLLCSGCKVVEYCSEKCQTLDWYAKHIHNCERMGHQLM